MNKILAACGNDCAKCPRYNVHPYEKTEDELSHTAKLWYKIGYRDHIVTNEEIACSGCKSDNFCRFNIVKCCEDKHIATCSDRTDYPCDTVKDCFKVTKPFEPACHEAFSEDEYKQLKKAFFEKEKNLNLKKGMKNE